MKRMIILLTGALFASLSLCGQSATDGPFRQVYPLDPARVQANAARVAADLASRPEAEAWKQAPFVYYTVPAISPVKRLSDVYPTDGEVLAPLDYVVSLGEYAAGSIQLFPFANVDRFELKAKELKTGDGAVIPAAALDIKLVKLWYQAGSAWHGHFADITRRVLCPELLVYDEDLIRVDPTTQDNYVRYDRADGTRQHVWMSFNKSMANYYESGQANVDRINDAAAIQSAVLNKDEFKQFFVTLGVPGDARAGLYDGEIELLADGRRVGAVPVRVRVLPFELPRPRTNYNLDKEFYGSLYWQQESGSIHATTNPKLLANLKRHNVLHPLWHYSAYDNAFKRLLEAIRAAGLPTNPLFGVGPHANHIAGEPPTDGQQRALNEQRARLRRTIAIAGHSNIYCYAIDEAGPETIRQEQESWRVVHEEGAKVMVSTHPHRKLLFALDYHVVPSAPYPEKYRKEADLVHEANPDALVAWYADPHSGPESPEFARRVYGLLSYKSNYDGISQYVWYRNNWNDFSCMWEPNMRGLMLVYPTRDDVLDTLAWEGLREGLNDIRYATKLKLVAREALQSGDAEVKLLGRRALGMVAYYDGRRGDMDQFRYEAIDYILRLEAAMKGVPQ
jgi:hypothetical protein